MSLVSLPGQTSPFSTLADASVIATYRAALKHPLWSELPGPFGEVFAFLVLEAVDDCLREGRPRLVQVLRGRGAISPTGRFQKRPDFVVSVSIEKALMRRHGRPQIDVTRALRDMFNGYRFLERLYAREPAYGPSLNPYLAQFTASALEGRKQRSLKVDLPVLEASTGEGLSVSVSVKLMPSWLVSTWMKVISIHEAIKRNASKGITVYMPSGPVDRTPSLNPLDLF